jgi:hypothetical protein
LFTTATQQKRGGEKIDSQKKCAAEEKNNTCPNGAMNAKYTVVL